MKLYAKTALLVLCLGGMFLPVASAASPGGIKVPVGNWKLKAVDEVKDRADMMQTAYSVSDWVNATVPGTVFTSFVNEGLEKDPNFGDNIYRVPKEKYNRDFWYRTEFKVPEDFTGKHTWINFEGINRQADVYVNGSWVGSTDGFYERGHFDISSFISPEKLNVLAVLVKYPREPIPNYASPTYISSAGWDWMPYVPGLLNGITDDVYLSSTGEVEIVDPWIRTDTIMEDWAELSLSVELKNSSVKESKGKLIVKINPGNIVLSREVKIRPEFTTSVYFNPRRDSLLRIMNPELWWPNGYGEQNLYSCELSFVSETGISDSKTFMFGIRKYSYDTTGNVLHISVNGTPVFLKGGNWGMSEYLLRCRGEEYETKIRLHKEMNYNMIRNWIGSTTDEEFYQACDKYGIMVWDDFWLNSHNNLPTDVFAFNRNAVEKIKRLRNYASIALWCGDNEGYPLPPLNNWLAEDVRVFDGGDRKYHANSHSDALSGSGIWVNLEPQGYFASPPLGFGGETGWGLRSEIGTAVFTNFESFKKFMPESDWWPLNEMWNKHFFGPSAGNAGPDTYLKSIEERYGKPQGIEDFCKKAQLLNIETNKGMYEGWLDHMWDDASGILIWMSQSAYPSFVWQTYDYYYDLNGAYWGAKSACEPLHILWNCASNDIKVTNTSSQDFEGLTATAVVYNPDGKKVPGFEYKKEISVASNAYTSCFTMKFEDEKNLAFKKPVTASSYEKSAGKPEMVNDGGVGSRWGSEYKDGQWICIDLEEVQTINQVQLYWEAAYAADYSLQVSDDGSDWKTIYASDNCDGGKDVIDIDPVSARYVRMLGGKRATQWGFSLWEFKIFNRNWSEELKNPLKSVHFIRLELRDHDGVLLSENFYWRANEYLDYRALNEIPEVKLKLKTKTWKENGKQYITATIKSPKNAGSVAFANRVMLINSETGEQLLPAFMDSNYFTLMPGESRDVKIEFDAALPGAEKAEVIVKQYATPEK